MSKTAENLTKIITEFSADDDKFESGNKSAGVRARKALQEMRIICGARRKEMLDKK